MDIRDVISGERQGLAASITRGGLSALVPFYAAAVGLRNRGFDRGWKKVHRAAWPVISVGNITTGGTGKTPVVAWLAQHLRQTGRRPVLLSRGYKSLDGSENDEKRLLDELCPGVPHLQDSDRVRAAHSTVERQMGDVFILDDGFQHRRLHRDFDLVLIDAVNPWGHGHLLPRGLLREPMRSLARADVIVITRSELVSDARLAAIRNDVQSQTGAPIVITRFRPSQLVSSEGDRASLELLKDAPFVASCGIGNPTAFAQSLQNIAGPSLRGFRPFPDHHHYTPSDVDAIQQWCVASGGECVVVTRKDLVKLARPSIGSFRLWAVDVELDLMEGHQQLMAAIKQTLESPRVANS